MGDRMDDKTYFAAIDCLASDLVKVKYEMEDRGRGDAAVRPLGDAFDALCFEAKRVAAEMKLSDKEKS